MPLVILPSYLEISGIPLATPAWTIPDLSPLLDGPDVRGSDRILPGVNGVKPYPRESAVSVRQLDLDISGVQDQDGNYYGNIQEGYETNLLYLRANLLAPVLTGDGTRPAVLHLTSGATLEADVHVLPPLKARQYAVGAGRGVLEISIPSGQFS